MNDTVNKHDLRSCMKLSHTVIGAQWNDDEGLWHVKVKGPDGEEIEDTAHVLYNGTGVLK